ncbi:MAG TPA: hypothetical protein VL981_00390, partial [Candidatus Methylacidiphilales bacterium]|nr:hypothetical protein [Candidatus Methylacidiphilales bacterium]
MNLQQLIGCMALVMMGIYLLHLNFAMYRKIGMALIWLASGLGSYFFTGSVVLAVAVLLMWIFFPLWEMVFILRQLRVPRHRELADARAPRGEF